MVGTLYPPFLIGSKTFDFSRRYIMGILNVTPDSFSDGGQFFDVNLAVDRALVMALEGADIIDVGGESTRPGSEPVELNQELARVIPMITKLRAMTDIPISIDTYKSEVAEAALESGADMINDISGLRFDSAMATLAAHKNVPVVVMHIQGQPRSMQQNPAYDDLIGEIKSYLAESIRIAESAGIPSEMIVIDPGIGFGKTFEHNFTILNRLSDLLDLGHPILVGASRKRFLGSLSGTESDDRLEESLAAAVIAAMNGASIIRTHDVAATKRALRVCDAVKRTTQVSG